MLQWIRYKATDCCSSYQRCTIFMASSYQHSLWHHQSLYMPISSNCRAVHSPLLALFLLAIPHYYINIAIQYWPKFNNIFWFNKLPVIAAYKIPNNFHFNPWFCILFCINQRFAIDNLIILNSGTAKKTSSIIAFMRMAKTFFQNPLSLWTHSKARLKQCFVYWIS